MKTKSLILIISILTLILGSCGNKESEQTTSVVASVVKTEPTTQIKTQTNEFANPAFFEGSNFGAAFIAMLRTQNYDMALKFISKNSVDKFGVDKIKKEYQNFKFNYNLILKSQSQNGDVITLKFGAKEFATSKFKEMKIIIENDSCKLVLPEKLDEFLK